MYLALEFVKWQLDDTPWFWFWCASCLPLEKEPGTTYVAINGHATRSNGFQTVAFSVPADHFEYGSLPRSAAGVPPRVSSGRRAVDASDSYPLSIASADEHVATLRAERYSPRTSGFDHVGGLIHEYVRAA
jgi:hypothetical protein